MVNGKNVIGLTGGLGMGKSTMGDHMQRWGYGVIDSDVLARQVVEPGQPALSEVVEVFGRGMVDQDGRLRREVLAEAVFGDPERRRRLEAILHPRIRERWLAEVARLRGTDCAGAVVVIPLLFETGAEGHFDWVLCVACSARSQRERLLGRGWTIEQAEARNRAQWPIERKMASSDHVIWTEGTPDLSEAQLRRLLGSRGLPVC